VNAQDQTQQGVDVGRIASIVANRWLVVLGCMVVVVGGALVYVEAIAKPVFEATATVIYQAPSQDNPTGGALPSTGLTPDNVATLIAGTSRVTVVNAAATKAGVTPDKLLQSVSVVSDGGAQALKFDAKALTAQQSADLANDYANAFVTDRQVAATNAIQAQIDAKQRELAKLGKISDSSPNAGYGGQLNIDISTLEAQRTQWSSSIQVATQAQPPKDAIWPKKTLTLFASVIIGFALGVGVALLTARGDHRLHGDEWDEMPAPVLVRVPLTRNAPKNGPLGPDRADPLVGDAFAALGARIMLDRAGEGAHVVLVTSARSGEGKSTVAANLASALAQGGRRVVLVDADLRKPTQAEMFPALKGRAGLSNVLIGATPVEHALTLVAPNLAAIASGPRQSNASTLLASVSFRNLVDRLSNICEIVVIDAPPVLAVSDPLAMAATADQALLCARAGSSDAHELEEAHARMAGAAPNIAQAVVLVGTERPRGYGYDNEDLWGHGVANGGANVFAGTPALPAAAAAATAAAPVIEGTAQAGPAPANGHHAPGTPPQPAAAPHGADGAGAVA
jgi:capsular exopolysaccharide synthesis family protein